MIEKLKPGDKVPFTRHLDELRKRLILCVLVVLGGFFAVWPFSDIMMKPFYSLLSKGKLVFLTPSEAFVVHMKVSFYAALSVSVPILLYQSWAFVSPGLLKNERRGILMFIAASSVLFPLGAAFCFFIILPYGLDFLLTFGGESVAPMLSLASLVGFALQLMFVFGLVFQLPVIVVFLNIMEFVTVDQLKNFRRYLIVSAFIFAAILTPPDVVSQTMLALPLVLLYEASILFLRIAGKKQFAPKEAQKQAPIDQLEEN